MTSKNNLKGSLILMITAMVWGASFVSQSVGASILGPNSFNGIRMLLGALALLPLAIITERKAVPGPKAKKKLFISGILCGSVLCAASTVQTWGIQFTTAGKSGFITAMYIIFVPIISVVIGKKITLKTVVCALIATAGLYMLSVAGSGGSINRGDIITLVCAVLFAIHIILIDITATDVNVIAFSCIQFFTNAVINIILCLIFEHPSLNSILQSTIPLLYSGLMSCGVAYTLQPLGQRYADPSTASIIMSMESVFAVIFGIIILHSVPAPIEIVGCIVMFAAIVLSQLNILEKKPEVNRR